jgi:hypothetical protein
MKNRLLIYTLFFSISTFIYSQKRTDGVVNDFIMTGDSLTKANLYWYDKDKEKWIEKENAVNSYFGTPQFKIIIFNNEKFFIMTVKSIDVRYKYPTLEKERYIVDIYKGFIFKESEYLKLKSLNTASTDYGEIRTTNFDLEEFRIKVLKRLKGEIGESERFIMKIKKEDNVTIRFMFPETEESWRIPFEKRYFETSIDEFNKLFINE